MELNYRMAQWKIHMFELKAPSMKLVLIIESTCTQTDQAECSVCILYPFYGYNE